MRHEPDLTAELDAAGAIVMHGATVETRWGSLDYATGHVFDCHTTIEDVAASVVAARKRRGFDGALVCRTVTYGPWEEVPEGPERVAGPAEEPDDVTELVKAGVDPQLTEEPLF